MSRKLKAPSPAMGVALLALGMASTGSAFAAASYVANAGKVDGRDAVSSTSSLSKAAGNLVSTSGSGTTKGQIPAKFLAGVMNGDADTFSHYTPVPDNAADVPATITGSALGPISATCSDQNAKPGIEDPTTRLIYSNTTGQIVDLSRQIGNAAPEVTTVAPNTTSEVVINGSNTFHILLELRGTDATFDGVVRQDGRGSADASCFSYGYSQQFTNVR